MNNKDTLVSLLLTLNRFYFTNCFTISIVDFEQVNVIWVALTLIKLLKIYCKTVQANKVTFLLYYTTTGYTTYRFAFNIFCHLMLKCRSSRSQMFFKIGVFINFAIFTGKHPCWSLFLVKLQVFI